MNITAKINCKKYLLKNNRFIKALNNIHCQIQSGKITGIIGESGSGKTTLAKILSGYDNNFDGEVLFQNNSIHKLSFLKRAQIVQLIFQNPYKSLDPRWKIKSSLAEIQIAHKLNKLDFNKRIYDLLELFSLTQRCLNSYPSELSGGQLQRIIILRALMANPYFLVTDECLSSLDVTIQKTILATMKLLVKNKNLGICFITHDIRIAQIFCDDILVLNEGATVEHCNQSYDLKNSSNLITRKLLRTELNIP